MSDEKAPTDGAGTGAGSSASRPASTPPRPGSDAPRPSGIPLPSSLSSAGNLGAPPPGASAKAGAKLGSRLKAPKIASAVPRPSSRPPPKGASVSARVSSPSEPDLHAGAIPPQSVIPTDLVSEPVRKSEPTAPRPGPIPLPRPAKQSAAGKPAAPGESGSNPQEEAPAESLGPDSGVIMSRIVEVQGSEEPAPPSAHPVRAAAAAEPEDEEEDEQTEVTAPKRAKRVPVAAVPVPVVPKPGVSSAALPPLPAPPPGSSSGRARLDSEEIPIDVGTPGPEAVEDVDDSEITLDSVPPEADDSAKRGAAAPHLDDATVEIPSEELLSESQPPPSVRHFMQQPVAQQPVPPPAAPPVSDAATAQLVPQPPPPPLQKKPRRSKTPPPGAIAAALSQPPPASTSPKRRLWWEEMFNEEFQRGTPEVLDSVLAADADFIQTSLGLKPGARVLDVGCGRGEHALELSARDYDVVGIDISKSQLVAAGEYSLLKGKQIKFLNQDMRDMTFEEEFDAIYCWNTSFGYFEEEKNTQVMRNVFNALRPGGRFLLDVVNRDFAIADEPCQNWFEGDGCACMDDMSVDFITSRMRVKRTMIMDDGRNVESHYSIRIYSLHELGKMFHEVGFRVTQASGDPKFPGVLFGAQSPRLIILAVKP